MQSSKESNTSARSAKRDPLSVVRPEEFCIANSKSNDGAFFANCKGFSALFEGMLNSCAYCRIVYEKGVAVDFIHEKVNPAFSKRTGSRNLVGMTCSEALPCVHTTNPELLERFTRVAESGIADRFEISIDSLNSWYDISAFSSIPGEFFIEIEALVTD